MSDGKSVESELNLYCAVLIFPDGRREKIYIMADDMSEAVLIAEKLEGEYPADSPYVNSIKWLSAVVNIQQDIKDD